MMVIVFCRSTGWTRLNRFETHLNMHVCVIIIHSVLHAIAPHLLSVAFDAQDSGASTVRIVLIYYIMYIKHREFPGLSSQPLLWCITAPQPAW